MAIMKGLFIVIFLVTFWIVSGVMGDIELKNPPFTFDDDDLSAMSGYNHMHAIRENDELVKLEIYDQQRQLAKTYVPNDLNELYPSANYKELIEVNNKLYVVYEHNGIDEKKRLVVGARGTLTFMPERP